APIIAYTIISLFTGITFPDTLFIIVLFTIVCTLAVTWLTPPTDRSRLESFYRTTRVGGIFWTPIARNLPDVKADTGFPALFADWFFGIVLVYSVLFGTGKLIFGEPMTAIFYFAAGAAAGFMIFRDLSRRNWKTFD
ncbi:MAG: sodium:proline symporter, partial [Chlorobiaceae bacterium]|nr:sodium:proline symporter [Chlorobiaceae bacterium]